MNIPFCSFTSMRVCYCAALQRPTCRERPTVHTPSITETRSRVLVPVGPQRSLPRLCDTYDTRTTTYQSAYSTAVQLRQPITGGHSRQLHLRPLLRVGGTGTEVRCHVDIPHRNDDVVRNAGLQEEEEEEEEEEKEEEEALKPTLATLDIRLYTSLYTAYILE